jgi:RNA polymerase sigma-70 factor (ECF subfamily)
MLATVPGMARDAGETHAPTDREDSALVAALRAGDEAAFRLLVDRYGGQMLRVARFYVPSTAVAEEVVQETWLALLEGLDRFEGRSSLKTWIFRVLANRARTRGVRERRSLPFSAAEGDDGPTVEPSRFEGPSARWAGHWSTVPDRFSDLPEVRLLADETLAVARRAIDALPARQRTVIGLRDLGGWDADEVSELLEITPGNQRVLLHRARAAVRRALEEHLDG